MYGFLYVRGVCVCVGIYINAKAGMQRKSLVWLFSLAVFVDPEIAMYFLMYQDVPSSPSSYRCMD